MAEYISKNDIKGTGLIFTGEDDMYTSAQADGADKMWNKILSLPTADVIEREKIDKAIKEMKLEYYNLDSCDNRLIASYWIEKSIKILKRNIGDK